MRHLILILLLTTSTLIVGQNIVPNGDFENYTNTPSDYSQWHYCIGWSNVNGYIVLPSGVTSPGTPDYYHALGSGDFQLPSSWAATLPPFSGSAIMGFYTFIDLIPDYREYINPTIIRYDNWRNL